jgi:hypothetical protein
MTSKISALTSIFLFVLLIVALGFYDLKRTQLDVILAFSGTLFVLSLQLWQDSSSRHKKIQMITRSLAAPSIFLLTFNLSHSALYFLLVLISNLGNKDSSNSFSYHRFALPIMLVLCRWEETISGVYAENFSIQNGFIVLTLAFGFSLLILNKLGAILISYIGSTIVTAFLLTFFTKEYISYYLLPSMNGVHFLFIFFLVCDPLNVPIKLRSQIAFGVFLGLLNLLLQSLDIFFSSYIALFFLSFFRKIYHLIGPYYNFSSQD